MMNVNQPVLNRSMKAAITAKPKEGFITKDEVARRLKKTTRTVENWQRVGHIPFVKVGNNVLYRWSDVQRALERKFKIWGRCRCQHCGNGKGE